ncbi:MAG: ABC transporter permease [Armatimonadota bacterium]|nr:MAG: ABC transporter permease [Armatimonadota bacterium]
MQDGREVTAGAARTGSGGEVGNRLFAALLCAVLVVFLAACLMVLLSNVWYLAQAEATEGQSGWDIFVGSLRDPEVHFAIRLSVTTALLTMIVSLVFAIPAAYLLSRHHFRGEKLVDTVLDLPIVVPPPVMGMSLLMFFSTPAGELVNRLTPQPLVIALNALLSLATGHPIADDGSSWVYTTRGIVMAQFFVACAFGVRAIKASFDTIGVRHENVARTLGCTRWQAFYKVVLPMAASGLVAGAVMTWARAIAEFGPVLFFAGSTRWKTEVMPIGMFLMYSSAEIEKAVALVIIMILISTVTLLAFKKLGGKGYLW